MRLDNHLRPAQSRNCETKLAAKPMACISSTLKSSIYNFLRVSGGRPFFARVGITPTASLNGVEILIPRTAFEHPKGMERHPDWAAAAERGIRYALTHASPPHTGGIHLTVNSILGTEVDTTVDAVATAACFATWDALEISSAHPPRLEAGNFIFEP